MSILLICGPKHAGKTTVLREMSSLLPEGEYYDLDELVAGRTGKTPRALYREGEALFQKAEAEALAGLMGESPVRRVIAGGGGLIDNAGALPFLAPGRIVPVYLALSPSEAWRRIRAAGPLPPFLETASPERTHAILHERRAAAYLSLVLRLGGWAVQAEKKAPKLIAREIASLILERGL
jgi:shikimate kinase